jgi:hypothetical protein
LELLIDGRDGTCVQGSRKGQVVAADDRLKLSDGSVALDDLTFADDLTDPVIGEEVKPQGVFALFRLTVANNGSKPQAFNYAAEQVRLYVKRDLFTPVDYDVQFGLLGGGADTPLFIQEEIQPGSSLTGNVVFDVPADRKSDLSKPGAALAAVDFRDAEAVDGFENASQVGFVSLAH